MAEFKIKQSLLHSTWGFAWKLARTGFKAEAPARLWLDFGDLLPKEVAFGSIWLPMQKVVLGREAGRWARAIWPTMKKYEFLAWRQEARTCSLVEVLCFLHNKIVHPAPEAFREAFSPAAVAHFRAAAQHCRVAFNVIFCLDYLAMSQDVDGVEKCSVLYWIALLGLYPVVAVSLLLAIRFMRELAEWHASRHDPPVQGDPVLGRAGLVVVPFLAMAVGLLAGLLGLGGGEFMVPLLLELGVQARVAAATSGFLIFFNTSSNVVHYLVAGTIEPFMGYGIACFFMAMMGSFCGLLAGNTQYVRNHSYIIIFLVAFALLASALLLLFRGFSEINWTFGGFC
eukprot:s212_g19.t1